MGNLAFTTTAFLLGVVLVSPIASQTGTTSQPAKPKPDFRERLRKAESRKQARRWVTFLELDNRRAEAANALLRMGPDAVPALVQAFDNPRPVVFQRAAPILRALGSQAVSAKARLQDLSHSDDKQLAYAAGHALVGIQLARIQPAGITLVAAWGNHKVLELDKHGKVTRSLTGVKGPWDVERLPNGNYLICGYTGNKVVEMTAKGEVVWSYAELKSPRRAQRLPNGNTLIADHGGGRVLEVDRAGKTVWKYDKAGIQPFDVDRLVSGNTLIADHNGTKGVREITPKGEVVWAWQGLGTNIVTDADRLPNGNTLITLCVTSAPGKVLEVTPKGKVLSELKGLSSPRDADRAANGHTLVALQNEVAEYDAGGKKIWSTKVRFPGKVSRY